MKSDEKEKDFDLELEVEELEEKIAPLALDSTDRIGLIEPPGL